MPNFYEYNPEQGYVVPPNVRDVLGEDHLCFFVDRAVEGLDLRAFEENYSDVGHPAYPPVLLLKVWLYAYALGMNSSRRLEQRIREDLAFRYLAGGLQPDYWALNDFCRRHERAMNDVFTQAVEMARAVGLGKLGHVAIDSTRIAANAAADSTDTMKKLRGERAKIRKRIRRWQKQCGNEDPNETAGTQVGRESMEKLERRLKEIPGRIERLKKAGMERLSRSDAESRFLRKRGGFVLGYTATIAVSEDHLIVAQQVSVAPSDHDLLVPMVEAVREQCGERPQRASADSGFFRLETVKELEQSGVDVYMPDATLARELNTGHRARRGAAAPVRDPVHRRLRAKLRSPDGRAVYAKRKAMVEPVFGVLKQQRGMRQFRRRGLAKVAVEFTLAAIAYNLTRLRTMTIR